jgi:hypothetical protein
VTALEFLAGTAGARLVAPDLAAIPDEGLDRGGTFAALLGHTLTGRLSLGRCRLTGHRRRRRLRSESRGLLMLEFQLLLLLALALHFGQVVFTLGY